MFAAARDVFVQFGSGREREERESEVRRYLSVVPIGPVAPVTTSDAGLRTSRHS